MNDFFLIFAVSRSRGESAVLGQFTVFIFFWQVDNKESKNKYSSVTSCVRFWLSRLCATSNNNRLNGVNLSARPPAGKEPNHRLWISLKFMYQPWEFVFISPMNHRDKQRFVPYSHTKWLTKDRDFAHG